MANEKRLIDANDALEQLKQAEKEMCIVPSVGCKAVDINAVLRYIERRPTVDAVEVVRCKDCQHYSCGFCMHSQWWNEDDATTVESDDFCSLGERKDNV